MAKIDDGTGSNRKARVTTENRLSVDSVVFTGEDNAVRRGEGWQIVSAGSGAGNILFNTNQQTAVLYFSNTGELDIVVDRIVIILGTATGGTGDWLFQLIRNPTGGTIIDNAVSAGISNSNHGSAKAYPGVAYRSLTPVNTGTAGTNYDTFVGGTGAIQPLKQTIDRVILPVGRRIPPGFSIGCTLEPPSGTTSANALVVAHVYTDEDSG